MRICLSVRRVRGTANKIQEPHRFSFEQNEVLIGRDEAVEVRLPDPAVSLVHLRLLHKKGRLFAIDAGSTNGTWLEGCRLVEQEPVEVTPGTNLAVGPFVLSIEEPLGEEVSRAEDTAALARKMVLEVLGALGGGHPWLEVQSGPQQGVRFDLPPGGPYLIGRGEECTLRIDDADASRQHLELRRHGDRVIVRDLGSKNGFLLNGQRAQSPCLLQDGDELRVGSTQLRFSDPADRYLKELTNPDPTPDPVPVPVPVPVSVPDPVPVPVPVPKSAALQALLVIAGLLVAAGIAALIYLLI